MEVAGTLVADHSLGCWVGFFRLMFTFRLALVAACACRPAPQIRAPDEPTDGPCVAGVIGKFGSQGESLFTWVPYTSDAWFVLSCSARCCKYTHADGGWVSG